MRKWLTYILLFSLGFCQGQEIIIQPPLFIPFECTEFYKLYTGIVTNFSDETYNTKLLLEVDYTSPSGNSFRLADGILSGNPSVDFPPGTININNATYESFYPVRNITFYDRDIENLLARTKCLPPGQYDVCLTLLEATAADTSPEFLTQTCYTREKQMLSNLLLVSPFENEEINIDLPLFTWTPVTPINPGAMYRIQMVEILANQTAFEAFRSNPIFYEQSGLMSNIFQYPVAARTMLPCTRYAWRVTYELAGGFVSTAFQKSPDFLQESEIWEFQKPCDEEEEEEEPEEGLRTPIYYHKTSNRKGEYYFTQKGNLLWIEIDNPYKERERLNIAIESQNGSIQYATCCEDLESSDDDNVLENGVSGPPVQTGANYFKIDLNNYNLNVGQTYTIIFTDFKQDLFINFKYEEDEK